ncbi:retrovirus-related pol polyprotein from transposon TNT 1-94 [Tanacetum coccineum]
MIEFPQIDSGLVVLVFNQGDDPISYLNKAMVFLTAVASSRITVQQVQGRKGRSYDGTSYKGNATSLGGNNAGGRTRVVKCYNCQGEGYMARKCTQPKRPRNVAWIKEKAIDDVSNAKVVLMANLSNYGSDIILEAAVQDTYSYAQDSMILSVIEQIVISSQHVVIPVINDEETLILEEVSRSKMLAKQNDPMSKEKRVNTTPINYVELNRLSEDFGKCFVPQQEFSIEQAFWLQTSHPNTDQSASSPVKTEAPKELSKVSMVNTNLKKLKYHLGQFDTVVKKRITPNAITEGKWGFEHTKVVFLNEIIPFLNTLKDIFNIFDKDLLNELQEKDNTINKLKNHIKSLRESHKKDRVKQDVDEIETINIELEHNVSMENAIKRSNKRVKSSTSSSRSQPSGNTKNNRILRPTSSNMKNKVEDHPRSVKSKSNKMNHVVKSKVDDHPRSVKSKHLMLNANSKLICATCNKCMFDAIHDMCVIDFVKDVNVSSKYKSAKSIKKQNIWKPTGKVFTDVGYRWKPTGITFTLVDQISCQTPPSLTPSVPPTKKDWEILFQLMFDEYFSPLTSVVSLVPAAVPPVPTDLYRHLLT